MPCFSELPSELVEQIVSYLAQKDVYAVSQLNKSLHNLSIPFLYKHLDLIIPPGEKVPRVDRACLNLFTEPKRAKHIKKLGLGISARGSLKDGQRWLPKDKFFPDAELLRKFSWFLEKEPLIMNGHDIRDGLSRRDYGVFGTLIVLVLPNLRCLDIADLDNSTLWHLGNVFSSLEDKWSDEEHSTDSLLNRLSSIEEIKYRFEKKAGITQPYEATNSLLRAVLTLPSIRKLEMIIPDHSARKLWESILPRPTSRWRPVITNITTIIIRHSSWVSQSIEALIRIAPKLKSLTCELMYDPTKSERLTVDANTPWINLLQWNDWLRPVKDTLESLVLSVEYCDSNLAFYAQPSPAKEIVGFLDLTFFNELHTLEAPLPFITGDVEFSITHDFYPMLPPNLRNLSLRTDISHAQHLFPFDQSILESSPTFAESADEAKFLMAARMDLSYTFQAALSILDHANGLQEFSVWQPADPSLEWFEGQIEDFATTCRNKGVTPKLLYPMLMRWKKPEHWDLCREVTLVDLECPERGRFARLWRGDRKGVPLGLAMQFHLGALRAGKVLGVLRTK